MPTKKYVTFYCRDLSYNHLNGSIPSSYLDLPHLQKLYVSFCSLALLWLLSVVRRFQIKFFFYTNLDAIILILGGCLNAISVVQYVVDSGAREQIEDRKSKRLKLEFRDRRTIERNCEQYSSSFNQKYCMCLYRNKLLVTGSKLKHGIE